MKRKSKNTKRKRKLTFGEEIIKSLREFLDELKRQRTIVVAPPQPQTIIIKLPNIGDDDGPGNPVPWRPMPGPSPRTMDPPWEPTCHPTSFSTATTGTVKWTQTWPIQ